MTYANKLMNIYLWYLFCNPYKRVQNSFMNFSVSSLIHIGNISKRPYLKKIK